MADDLRVTQEFIRLLTTEDAGRKLRVTQEELRALLVPNGDQKVRITQEEIRLLFGPNPDRTLQITQESITILFTPIRVYEMVTFNDLVTCHLARGNVSLSENVTFSAFFNKRGDCTDGVKFNDILVYKAGWELQLIDGVAFNDGAEPNVVYLPISDGVKFNEFVGYSVSQTAVTVIDGVSFHDMMYDPFFVTIEDGVKFTDQGNLFTDNIADEIITFTGTFEQWLDFWSYGSANRLYSDDLNDYPDHYWMGDLVDLDWDSSSISDDWHERFVHAHPDREFLDYYSYRRLQIADSGPGWIELVDTLEHYIFPFTVFNIYKDNIKKESFRWTRSAERDKTNRIQLKYLNRDDDYKIDIIIMDNEASQDWNRGIIRSQTYEVYGVKRTNQASRLAQIILDEGSYADWSITFITDTAGYKFCMGEIIGVTRSELGWFAKLFRINSMEEQDDYQMKITAIEYKPELYTENPPLMRSSGSLSGRAVSPYTPPEDLEAIFAFEEYLNPRIYVMAKPYADAAWNFAGIVMNYAITAGLNIYPVSTDWRNVEQVVDCPPSMNMVVDRDKSIEYDPTTMYGSFPASGVIMIGEEMIRYTWMDDATNSFRNLTRGYNETKKRIHENLLADRIFLFTDNIWYYEYAEEDVGSVLWIVARPISPGGVINSADDPQEYWISIGGQALKPLKVGSLKITVYRGVEVGVPGLLTEAAHYEQVNFNDYCTNTNTSPTTLYLWVRDMRDSVRFMDHCHYELGVMRASVRFTDYCSVYVAETTLDSVSFFSYCANSYGTNHVMQERIVFNDICTVVVEV